MRDGLPPTVKSLLLTHISSAFVKYKVKVSDYEATFRKGLVEPWTGVVVMFPTALGLVWKRPALVLSFKEAPMPSITVKRETKWTGLLEAVFETILCIFTKIKVVVHLMYVRLTGFRRQGLNKCKCTPHLHHTLMCL